VKNDKMNSIKLMYITNNVEVAKIAEAHGVDRIFVDMEYIGKALRQGGMDTVQSRHTVEDIKKMRAEINKAELMVRCNPIHEATSEYCSSKDEIDAIVEAGADIIMLPYFKTSEEVKTFVELVGGRAKTFPLVETKEAVECLDEILAIDGIDEIYVGLNDLSLSYGKKFMFQILAEGKVDEIVKKFTEKGIPFGFGGVAAVGTGLLPGEKVLAEHYRLGSTSVILSRSFCNYEKIGDIDKVREIFDTHVKELREEEKKIQKKDEDFLVKNHEDVKVSVEKIVTMIG
jgi:2-keto-3-deoxy-L-rhamnonate aldolase RhmA